MGNSEELLLKESVNTLMHYCIYSVKYFPYPRYRRDQYNALPSRLFHLLTFWLAVLAFQSPWPSSSLSYPHGRSCQNRPRNRRRSVASACPKVSIYPKITIDFVKNVDFYKLSFDLLSSITFLICVWDLLRLGYTYYTT